MRPFLFAVCISFLCSISQAQDAAVTNPDNSKVEFENSNVRILRLRIAPHESLKMRAYPARAEVQLTDGSVRITSPGGPSQDSSVKAGEFSWLEPTKHAVENTGDTPLEIIEIELKKAADPGVSVEAPPSASDSVPAQEPVPVQDEPHHHWTFENQYVRVLDVRLLPGESTLFHTHSHDNIAVRVSQTSSQIQYMGKNWEPGSTLPSGAVSYIEGAKSPYTHRVKNLSATPFHVIDIEVLRQALGDVGSAASGH